METMIYNNDIKPTSLDLVNKISLKGSTKKSVTAFAIV